MHADSLSLFDAAERLLGKREYEAALALIDNRCGDLSSCSESDAAHLIILRSECLAFLGRQEEAAQSCGKLRESLSVSNQHSLFARCSLIFGIAEYYLGHLPVALEAVHAAMYSYKRANAIEGVVRCLNWIGNIAFESSDLGLSCRAYQECIAQAAQSGLRRWQAVGRYNLAKALALCGAIVESSNALEENRPELVESSDTLNILRSDLLTCFVDIQYRRYALARTGLTSLQEQVMPSRHVREQGAWCEYMGELELAEGNLSEAEKHLLHGISIASGDSHDESVIGQSRRLLAEVRLAQGNPAEAIAESERALQSIMKVGERFEEGVVYRVLAQARLELGREAEPRADYKQSVGILRDIGARFELAKSCLAAGSAHAFSRRERLAYLVEAERLFGEIGVEYWTEQTRESLKQVLSDREVELQAHAAVEPVTSSTLFITADRTTLQTLHLADCYARTDIGVLITGETGVGKDQLARYIHSISPRRELQFVAIDLNTIPETLLESTLFGHRKGSFTGAAGERIGLLESANGGTVFFNEIGNLPPAFQARLLEVLDTRQVRRLGETKPVALDIRFIAATNADLADAVNAGRFRSDLYYRFAEAPLHLLPLRERRADIIPLIRHFLMELGMPASESALLDRQLWVDRAHNGHWDGNVRRLRSFVRQLVAIAERPSDPEFPGWGARLLEQMDVIAEPNIGARVSRDTLVEALGRNQWNQRATARVLGITEGGIRHLMRRLSIQRPEMA